MACCCANEGMEPWDLPIEPEQGAPQRISELLKPVLGPKRTASLVPFAVVTEEVKLGKVAVPDGSSQGLEILHSSAQNLVVVCGITKDGPWDKWNDNHPDHRVQPGDQVVEVNGKRGDCMSIIKEMTVKTPKLRLMTMVVRRPLEQRVLVHKPMGDSLGLILVPLDNGNLFIDAVSEGGCIDKWNSKNPEFKVRSLDQIIEVNSVTGSAMDLVEAMKQDTSEVELVFLTHQSA